MREYKFIASFGPGITVKAPDRACLFCDHCRDILWDYSHGPYLIFCDRHEDVTEEEGPQGNCPDFLEEEENNEGNG